jgi:hypothetical protein
MFRALLPALLLSGCAASIQADEIDPFGMGASAAWVHWNGDFEYDTIILSNVGDVCGKLEALQEAADDYADAAEDIDKDDYCEEARVPAQKWARIADSLYHDGAHFVQFTVNEDLTLQPDEGTFEVGDLRDGLSGNVTYYTNDPFKSYLQDWDPDEDYEDDCGVDIDDADTDYWLFQEGQVEFTTVEDEQVAKGKLEVDLAEDDGDDAGELTSNFTAGWCEIEY